MGAKDETCVFCGGSLVGKLRAKEHVFPNWMQQQYGFAGNSLNPSLLGLTETTFDAEINAPLVKKPMVLKREREHGFQGSLAGNICSGCNGGWMSALEVETRPILTKLIADPQDGSVKGAEWFTLARWLLKTGFTFEQSNRAGIELIPPAHARLLKEGKLPDGVALFISNNVVDCPQPLPLVTRDWTAAIGFAESIDRDVAFAFGRQTYKVMIHFRRLVMTLAYVPPGLGWRVSTWPMLHRVVLNVGVELDTVPWSFPPPQERWIGLLSALSLLLSYGKYPVEGKTSSAIIKGQTIACHRYEVEVLSAVDRQLGPLGASIGIERR